MQAELSAHTSYAGWTTQQACKSCYRNIAAIVSGWTATVFHIMSRIKRPVSTAVSILNRSRSQMVSSAKYL